jgi:Icc-related predicted phosphoesterase
MKQVSSITPLPRGNMLNKVKGRLKSRRPQQPPQCFESAAIHYRSGRFAIVGDLQSTSRIEFWRKPNTTEQAQLIQQIAMEAPDFLAIVGDLVFCGSSAAHWAAFDRLARPLCHARVPVLPLLGNHDYWFAPRTALAHFFARFPHLDGRHWFSTTYGPLGLIFLDSNVRRLQALHWRQQSSWYQQELARFEGAADIRGVLVLLHHPPYTNSTLIADDLEVQHAFVPPFQQMRKTLLMVSGHVHSYERYERAGKTFLVTGGGGPRVKLSTGHRRRHADDRFSGPPLRGFHFLILSPLPSGLEVEMHGLQQPQRVFEVLDRFTLPWSADTEKEPDDLPGTR